jgi:hypothetical protein
MRNSLRDYDIQKSYLASRGRRIRRGSEDDGSVPLGVMYTLAFYVFMGCVIWRLIKVWLLL